MFQIDQHAFLFVKGHNLLTYLGTIVKPSTLSKPNHYGRYLHRFCEI